MGKKYSVGDKVVTADNWNDGMGRIIPKGSVVEIIRDFEYGGINMYDCEYNGGRCIYEEQWLGDKYVNPKIGGWITCSERLPEEKINPVTNDFYEYQVTFKSDKVTDVRHYKFGRGHWWNCGQNMDKYVTAWREPLEAYHG